jgi:dTDP-glucose 4,6-dehydratase
MRAKDGRAIPNFIMQALTGQPITVYGDGSQTRSFCYITDEVDGLYKLLMSNEDEPVNIGNPEEIPLLKIAKEIIELTKSKSKIVFEELPVNDPKVRQPDITKARTKLGLEPKVSRREGLEKTIQYFKELI